MTSLARGSHPAKDDNGNFNSKDDDSSSVEEEVNDKENHGLACTCCGIKHKFIVTESDMNQIQIATMYHISDFMITEITKVRMVVEVLR